MPTRNYKIYLSYRVRIIVYFMSEGKNILDFVVKIEYLYNKSWHEMERFDCAHGYVHKDILDHQGYKIRSIKYSKLDIKTGLDYAIRDFKKNHELIIQRFIHAKEEKNKI